MFQRKTSKYKKRWTQEETLTFLKHFKARKEEFKLARKRRLAYSRCLEDMLAEGFDPNTKFAHLEVKMQTLWRAYKGAKAANQEVTSYVPNVPPFFNEMEDIFGAQKNESFSFNAENFVFTVSDVGETRKPETPVTSFSSSDALPSLTGTSFEVDTIPDEVTIKSEGISDTSGKDEVIPEEVPIKIDVVQDTFGMPAFNLESLTSNSNVIEESASRDSNSSSSSSELLTLKRSKNKITRSEYYKIRIQQFEREQRAIAERWKQHLDAKQEWRRKKLELLERLLKK